VRHQRAQERMQRPKVLNLTQDQRPHGLDVCARVIPDPAGRGVDIPHGQREAQRPPARLLQGTLLPPWLEEMPLRLTHGTFEA
jgi:hypothetical protein